VIGEGAGIFVLEEHGHALKRGARIYGEILGYGTTLQCQERSMTHALEEAQRDLREVSFVYANGSGLPEEDILEAKSIARVFQNGARQVPVTASKSVTGHLVDAAGTTELSLALLAFERKIIPPVVNLEEPDPECDLNFVIGAPRPVKGHTFLLNAFGFGGQSAALVVGNGEK
jgi:3-oxoacyl-[acyl-carrier-protein] synthase II